MKTAIITDCKYRMSIPAIRALGRAGYRVIGTQTIAESNGAIPAFSSCYMSKGCRLEGSVADPAYKDRLLSLIKEFDHPLLLCIGAATLNLVSLHQAEFSPYCDFLIAAPEALDALNDKEQVHRRAESLSLPIPRQYSGMPDRFPVVMKPHCGEKLGLSAAERYTFAYSKEEFLQKLEQIKKYDPAPLVQEKLEGAGKGACLLIDQSGALVSAVCHQRIREYPISGGPSTCCISIYDEKMIHQAYTLLSSFGFRGMAMVEFKGDAILEVNPRIWGSFPLTECCNSSFILSYARAAAGEKLKYQPADYRQKVRMRFLLNDSISLLKHLSKGHLLIFLTGLLDCLRAKEALRDPQDPKPFRQYLRKSLINR